MHGRKTRAWALDHTRLDETGKVAAARVVQSDDQVTIITSNGIIIRTIVREIRQAGRASKGVRVVNIGEGDGVTAMARLSAAIEAKADADAQADAARSVAQAAVLLAGGQVAGVLRRGSPAGSWPGGQPPENGDGQDGAEEPVS